MIKKASPYLLTSRNTTLTAARSIRSSTNRLSLGAASCALLLQGAYQYNKMGGSEGLFAGMHMLFSSSNNGLNNGDSNGNNGSSGNNGGQGSSNVTNENDKKNDGKIRVNEYID